MNYLQQYPWLVSLPSLLVIAVLGMFTNFLKKKVKGETLVDIREYFSNNFKSTLTAFIATIVGAFGLATTVGTGQVIDIVAVFTLGYTFDSMFNKWDKIQ